MRCLIGAGNDVGSGVPLSGNCNRSARLMAGPSGIDDEEEEEEAEDDDDDDDGIDTDSDNRDDDAASIERTERRFCSNFAAPSR